MESTSDDHPQASAIYVELKERGIKAMAAGEFAKAKKYMEWALVEARRLGQRVLEERTYSDLAMVSVEFESGSPFIAELKTIVERGVDAKSRFQAAHALSVIHCELGQTELSAVYAYAAHGNAQQIESPKERAISSHTLGVQLLIDGNLQRSQRYLEQASELGEGVLPDVVPLSRSTLGYCLQRLGQSRRAHDLLRESVDRISTGPRSMYDNGIRLNLGFSLLEMDDYEEALELATTILDGRPTLPHRKSALLLAGEACSYLDNPDWSREYYSMLQEEFYPRQPEVLDHLQSVRTHRYVHWFA